jgi:PAS domain S-box-containing protein
MTDEPHYLEQELVEQIQTNPAMWEFLQTSSLDGVWYWDLENIENEWMSPEFWRLFGIDPSTRSHNPAEWQDMINPDDLKVALENFNEHCADPNHPYDQVVRYRHADGSTVWVRCRGLAIRDETGKPVRMLGAHNDITATKQAEELALAAQRAAQTANEELRAFAFSMSHDLKAPSNTLKMVLNEIREEHLSEQTEDVQELFDICTGVVDRMQMQIDDVLTFTRIVAEENLTLSPISLSDAAAAVLDDLAGEIKTREATVNIGALPDVMGAEVQIRALLSNLIGNALKYQRPDVAPIIEVRDDSAPGARHVSISVSDNGMGIPAASQVRVFEMFQRLHRYDEISGTGLGLAICRRVAQSLGGSISLTSTPGEGTTFTISLRRA